MKLRTEKALLWTVLGLLALGVATAWLVGILAPDKPGPGQATVVSYLSAFRSGDVRELQAIVCEPVRRRIGTGAAAWLAIIQAEEARIGTISGFNVLRGGSDFVSVELSLNNGRTAIVHIPAVQEDERLRICPEDGHFLGERA